MKRTTIFLGILAFIFMAIWAFVGIRYTMYSAGIYLLPVVIVVSGALSLATILFKDWRKFQWQIFYSLNIFLFGGLLIWQAIAHYKPTVTIYVPENYEGMVTVFIGEGTDKEVAIDDNGIGYFRYAGQVDWKVKHGNRNITDALNPSGSKELIFWEPDSLHYTSIDVFCFEVLKDKKYPSTSYNQKWETCMDENEYLDLVAKKWIDESEITVKRWER